MMEVRSLTKTYGPIRAVDELSFSAPAGKVTGLLGPNGAGKTTTLLQFSCWRCWPIPDDLSLLVHKQEADTMTTRQQPPMDREVSMADCAPGVIASDLDREPDPRAPGPSRWQKLIGIIGLLVVLWVANDTYEVIDGGIGGGHGPAQGTPVVDQETDIDPGEGGHRPPPGGHG